MSMPVEFAPFPANHAVQYREWYQDGERDALHNLKDKWKDPVSRMVIGWSSRRIVTQDGIHAAQDEDNVRMEIPPDFTWQARDLVDLPGVGTFQITGAVDPSVGFHNWRPGMVLELQRVEG